MKTYSHAIVVTFSVDSDHQDRPTDEEIVGAMKEIAQNDDVLKVIASYAESFNAQPAIAQEGDDKWVK